jgi:pimeloyl-ACP methyl ester carboxylesterase
MSESSYSRKEVDGLVYAEAGSGSDLTPVLLLHGMMGDISNWEKTIPAVAEAGYRIICPVLPVYSIPVRKANLKGLVRFVHRFVKEIHLEKAVVVGNSLGGHIAALYAMAHPEHVEAMVLTGASGIYEVEMSSSIMRRKDRDYLRERVEKTFFDPRHCTEELLDDVIDIINDREKAVRLIRFARSVQRGSIKDEIREIEVPTLLVWGKQDEITPPEVAHTFEEQIPNSELKWIDECGHAPMMERPDVFNRILIDFLHRTIGVPSQALAS